MAFSRQDQSQQQVPPPSSAQLVVRNKRGRKVDETLPKSHQREVQRQFRARRTSHLLELEQRVSILERENMILRHYAGFQPSNRPLLGRGPTGCDTTKPLIADESDPSVYLVRIEGWTAPANHSPLTATAHETQWSIPPPTASSLHPRSDYPIDPHSDHPYATYDGQKSADKLVFEPFEPLPTKIEHQQHSIPSYDSAHPTHFEPVQSPYDTAPPTRFDCLPPPAPETASKRETYSTPMSSLLSSNPSGTRHTINHGLYPSDSRTTSFTVNPQHDSTAVPPTPYQTGATVPPNLSVYAWSSASNGEPYGRSHAPSLSSVNLPTNNNGPGTTDHRHHFQGSSIPNYSYRPPPLNSFTPAPASAAPGSHPSFQTVGTPTESTFTT